MATATGRGDFDSLYRAHFADVRRFVFHFVQDAGVADELSQDAFLKALNAWGSYRGEAPEHVWLLRIARNVCLDYLRSPRARVATSTPLEVVDSAGRQDAASGAAILGTERPPSVEQIAAQAEMTDCVQRFVLSLSETLRTPLILHDMHGLTNMEIAQVLGCSLEAAKMRLHRARGELKQMMEERCDLFHDERNVLSCLPAPPESGFISLGEISDPARAPVPRA